MVINKARHPNLKLKSHNEGGWQSIKFDFYCFLRKSRKILEINLLIQKLIGKRCLVNSFFIFNTLGNQNAL